MPHLRLDLSAGAADGVDLRRLLEALAATLGAFETVAPGSIKAYAHVRTVWAGGVGAPAEFVHLEVGLLAGRSLELRSQIADALAECLLDPFRAGVQEGRLGLTVEVRSMDRETYRKCTGPDTVWHTP